MYILWTGVIRKKATGQFNPADPGFRLATVVLSAFMALNALSLHPANAMVTEDFCKERFANCIKLEDFEWLAGVSYYEL